MWQQREIYEEIWKWCHLIKFRGWVYGIKVQLVVWLRIFLILNLPLRLKIGDFSDKTLNWGFCSICTRLRLLFESYKSLLYFGRESFLMSFYCKKSNISTKYSFKSSYKTLMSFWIDFCKNLSNYYLKFCIWHIWGNLL